MIPHREIRLPLRAPGVLEDGYRKTDPWSYFLFKGLCRQGIYSMHAGLPGQLHKVFGEIVSPNVIMPQWAEDGISHLLYALFKGRQESDPLDKAIYESAGLPSLEDISNHPERWPGHYGYRIYGRPFIAWVHQRFGWESILDFPLPPWQRDYSRSRSTSRPAAVSTIPGPNYGNCFEKKNTNP